MEGEAVSNRPESPKKRIKSNPTSDSEAQPSSYSKSSDSTDGHSTKHVNGLAPTRDRKFSSSAADSSSERSESQKSRHSPRVQEEEVSSSENSVGKRTEMPLEGAADSLSKEAEDIPLICDSASSDLNDKH